MAYFNDADDIILSNDIIFDLSLWAKPDQLKLSWTVSKKFVAHVHSSCPQHDLSFNGWT